MTQLETALDEAAASHPDPGRPAVRRLTATEYRHAVSSLLAVNADERWLLFPPDDVDQDGFIDLLVTNEGEQKVLLRNKGDGTFEDITRSRKPPSGLVFLNPGNANGACIGDLDNDGDMDVFLPTADQANRLLISKLADSGKLTYKDVTLNSGIGDKDGARGCTMADFDTMGFSISMSITVACRMCS